MRTLKECQAEVFRRSQKRIEARRQRAGRIAAVCIPLVLLVAIGSAIALPAMLPQKTSDPGLSMGMLEEQQSESSSAAILSVQVTGPDRKLSHTDPDAVKKICQQLELCMLIPPGDCGTTGGTGDGQGGENKQSPLEAPVYGAEQGKITISLVTADGVSVQYCLEGTQLTNLMTGQTRSVLSPQIEQLLSLLGLTE